MDISDKELIEHAIAEELLLFASEDDYLAIANGVMELVNTKLRQQLAEQPNVDVLVEQIKKLSAVLESMVSLGEMHLSDDKGQLYVEVAKSDIRKARKLLATYQAKKE